MNTIPISIIQSLVGKNVGDLKINKVIFGKRQRDTQYDCTCVCGKNKLISFYRLLRNRPILSCGCRKNRSMPDGRKSSYEISLNYLFTAYKNGARSRNLEFEITLAQFETLIKQRCYYCDSLPEDYLRELKLKKRKISVPFNGLDRLKNNIGYYLNNVVPCCSICNRARSDMSLEDFARWIERFKSAKRLVNQEFIKKFYG